MDPYKLTFVYKTGFKDGLNGEDFKAPRKNAKKKNKFIGKDSAELSSYINNQVNKSCSHSSDATYRKCSLDTKNKISVELLMDEVTRAESKSIYKQIKSCDIGFIHISVIDKVKRIVIARNKKHVWENMSDDELLLG